MIKRTLACGVAALVFALQALPAAAADKIKIGFVSTLSGPGAALGIDIRDGFNLAIKHAGNRLGGLPVDLTILDDRQAPDVGKQEIERLLQQNKVDLITVIVISNELLPVLPGILQSKTFYNRPNTGPLDLPAAKCNPLLSPPGKATEIPGAMGELLNQRG